MTFRRAGARFLTALYLLGAILLVSVVPPAHASPWEKLGVLLAAYTLLLLAITEIEEERE